MSPDQRDRIIAAMDSAARNINGISLIESMQKAHILFTRLASDIEEFQTKEQLVSYLDNCENLNWADEQLLISTCRFAPQLLRLGTRIFAAKASEEFEPARDGRPDLLSGRQKRKVCHLVGQLLEQGHELGEAIEVARVRFDVSKHTIERVWTERRHLHSGGGKT